MSTAASVRLRRRTPLAACLYAALAVEALHSAPLLATTRLVTNCNNGGTGSLRGVVALSASNDTVSLASLGTCTITLSTASVSVGVANLTITGPSSNTVTISGDQLYRVFNHTGTGTLTLQHLVVSDGKYNTANGKGGCVKSAGAVTLQSSTMTNCNVKPVSGIARGGAIYAHGKVTLTNSTLTGNIAQGTGGAYGGAVLAGSIDTESSVISGNMARIPDGDYADSTSVRVEGGGLWTSGAMTSNNSIILSNAAIGPNTKGGCVLGKGTMYLGATTISNCNSYANYFSQGGGVYAAGALTLAHSTISNNVAGGDDGTYGGGLRAGSVTVHYSTIHGNYLGNGPHGFGGHANGGGMFVYQGATIVSNSTIDANNAGGTGGGIFGFHSNITISNSTISGNIADGDGEIVSTAGGGIAMQATAGTAATLMISNSTIAFNQAYTDFGAYGGAGVRAYGTAVIQSSIIANNLKHGQPDDFSCECGIAASPTISGSNNLIIALDPAGTPPPFNFVTRTTDPKLTPLSLHGGETAVHALNPSSPAVGNGNNVGSFTYDQRGFGFARNVGGATDIGAYEHQLIDDEIFYDGFGH